MRAEWDEWQEESAVSLASDRCAGCPGREGSHAGPYGEGAYP